MITQLWESLKGKFGFGKVRQRSDDLFEQVERSLPGYLSSAKKGDLLAGLKSFPEGMQYYSSVGEDEPLQGDGWSSIEVFVPEIKSVKDTNVLLLSNSCDLSAANARKLPMRALAAPLFKMSKIKSTLISKGASTQEVDTLFENFRAQKITNVFYLPMQPGYLTEDNVVFLDAISSQYLSSFYENANRSKMFSLSQQGAWLLSLKLSIHFCRLTDGAER